MLRARASLNALQGVQHLLPRVAALRAQAASSSMAATDDVILSHVSEGVGMAVLNRPKALNSLNQQMVENLLQVYRQWDSASSSVNCIILKGAGGKAFCAGGDVKNVVLDGMRGDYAAPIEFFKAEYVTDYAIAQLTKPHIALLDGIVMGGGAGVSMHGPFRVATEKTLFAMPECGIGLFPDIGSSHFLQRLPGHMGLYLALTGTRLKGLQVLEAGLATHYIPSESLPLLEDELQKLGPRARDLSQVHHVLTEVQNTAGLPKPTGLLDQLSAINLAFGNKDRVEDIVEALHTLAPQHAVCQEASQALQKSSPFSQKITFELMRRMAHQSLETCLAHDFRLAVNFSLGKGDFYEGVRATLIDRSKPPVWKYPALQEVPDEAVQKMFVLPAGYEELSVNQMLYGTLSRL